MRYAEMTSVAVLILLLSSCSSNRADHPNRSRVPTTEHPTSRAQFALSYETGSEDSDLVIRRAQQAVARQPAQADGYVRLAQAFMRKRRETADSAFLAYAKDAIEAAKQISPRDPNVLSLEIIARFDAHEFRAALKQARELIALVPDDPMGHLLEGDALLELGEYEPAVGAYQIALDRHPDLRSYSRAAHVRWLYGDYEGALELWEDALQSASARDPEPAAWCYAELGAMLLSRGNAEGALRSADSADKLVPGYVPALVLQGRALAKLGRTSDAIAALETAAARAPNTETLLLLSEQLVRAGRTNEAGSQMARAVHRAEHDPLPVALHYARNGIETERAVSLARSAVRDRKSIWAHDALALALLRSGDVAAASGAMDKAMSLGTPSAELHIHRGLILLAAGDATAAASALKAARAIDPDPDPIALGELVQKLEAGRTVALEGANR